jgi:hypothetical protein
VDSWLVAFAVVVAFVFLFVQRLELWDEWTELKVKWMLVLDEVDRGMPAS